jgi:bifunctional non-homologous end joining protein LigD
MAEITVGRKKLRLPDVDERLLEYYTAVAPAILPHLKRRMVQMTLPASRPSWIRICENLPIVQDLGSMLWLVNAGRGDLHVSAARCDDAQRPDYLEFDADAAAALQLRDALGARDMTAYAKTAGPGWLHVYAPIKRGPSHTQAWTLAEEVARPIAGARPCRSLACVYSADPLGRVSAPVTWKEIERGVPYDDFRMENMLERLRQTGELWKPLTLARGRASIDRMIRGVAA